MDAPTLLLAVAIVGLSTIGGTGRAPDSDAAPPPAGRFSHGAAGTARNGVGGEIAASPSMSSWPGTGAGGNGGPFAFIGAQYGSLWSIPPGPNNSLGVGYCVMEDVGGEGTVAAQPDPVAWDAGEMARAAALMATFGGDRVVPYGIDASGAYDVASGEWLQPALFGGGEYTRRRQVAVNFGVKMFVEDVSPSGAVAGRKLARDTAVVNGTGGDYSALRNGYVMAQRMATVAEIQHAVGGVRLAMVWATPDGRPPTAAGTYPLEVHATDSTGKAVGLVPVLQLSDIGIDGARSIGTVAAVDRAGDTPDDTARWTTAEATGWPTFEMRGRLADDRRFTVGANPLGADVTDVGGVARFNVTIAGPDWELAFHTQAPTGDVSLHSGTGVQGQITWGGVPQSASIDQVVVAPGRFVVRKVLDAADVQASRDMAGFSFGVARADGTAIGTFTTGTDGRTPPIEAPAGDYVISEVVRPTWADGLGDGGSVHFRFDPASGSPPGTIHAEVDYTNIVPTPVITTAARDAIDGDRFIDVPIGSGSNSSTGSGSGSGGGTTAGASILDTVTYAGLVPGTAYIARGELMLRTGDPTAIGVEPTGITASTPFTPTSATGSIDVVFDVPADRADLRGTAIVVFQRIVVASSERVVADHLDPAALDQTVFVPAISTELRRVDRVGSDTIESGFHAGDEVAMSAPDPWIDRAAQHMADVGDPVVDTVTISGLAPDQRYRLELTLHERRADGTCVATEQTATAEFDSARAASAVGAVSSFEVAVHGITIERPGVFVAFERLVVVDEDGAANSADRVIAVHEDCDDRRQTVWAPAISTAVAAAEVVGRGVMVDTIVIGGLADGRSDGATLRIEGGLFRHESEDRTSWICDGAHRIASFAIPIEIPSPVANPDATADATPNATADASADVTADLTREPTPADSIELVSPGEAHELGWHSYDVRLVAEFDDGSAWASAPHGCGLVEESFVARPEPDVTVNVTVETTVAPPATTLPPTTSTTTTSTTPPPTGTLPRTGGGPARSLGALALLVLGAGLVIVAVGHVPRTHGADPRRKHPSAEL